MDNFEGSRFPAAEFNQNVKMNPKWSSYTCFMECLRKRKTMSRRVIRKAFDTLVDKGDYAQKDKNEILNFICTFAYNKKGKRQGQNSPKLPVL